MATNLSEGDRAKLDGIVQKMVANKESDENIQWVVNDFKQRYSKSDNQITPTGDAEGMNVVQKTAAGVGGGLEMLLRGLQQGVAKLASPIRTATGMPQILPQITAEGEAARADLKRLTDQSTAAKIGQFVGETGPAMAIPGGVAGGIGKRMLTSALAGAGQGAAKFTGEGESTAQNIATGAAVGGAVPAVLAPLGKLVNAIGGKLQKPINVGATQKIPTTLGEDLANPHLQRVETFMERIPLIGTMGFRKKQYDASVASAKDYLGKYVAGDEGARGMLEANRGYVSKLYENVKSQVKGFDDLKAYAMDTAKASNEIMDTYPQFWEKFGNKKVLSMVKDFQGGTGKIHSFNDLWELRKGVGDIVGQAKAQIANGGVSKEQYAMASKLYSAINSDMDKFATSVGKPEISGAMKSANDAYKQFVVKYNILDRAMDKSMGQEIGGQIAGKAFSPQRFSSELNKILTKEKYSNLFTKGEKQEMVGMANIMSTVKRAGQFMENPPTGNRMIDVAIGGGAIGSFFNPAAATTMGTTAGVTTIAKFLTTTQAGKRFTLAASKIEPDSPAMKTIIDSVYKGAARMATNESLNKLNER